MDVQSGRISAGSPGGDRGWDEHAGSSPGVRPAPGHGAQDAGLFGPAGVSPAVSAKEAHFTSAVYTSNWRALHYTFVTHPLPSKTCSQSANTRRWFSRLLESASLAPGSGVTA